LFVFHCDVTSVFGSLRCIRISSTFWRVPASRDPLASDHHRNRVIESKRDYGCSSTGGTSDDSRAIVAPLEMPWPTLASRIEQFYFFGGERIEGARLYSFKTIAHSTSKAEVRFPIRSTLRLGDDVLNLEQPEHVPLRTLAVLAAMARPLAYASD
jgi:hypothetical protein